MKKLITLILVLCTLNSCKQEQVDVVELCQEEVCEEYLIIWENLLKSRNGLTDEYFNEHITVTNSEISHWNSGETFRVSYRVNIEWATIPAFDKFIIKIDPNAAPNPMLGVARGEYLTETEVNQVLSNRAFSSQMTKIEPVTDLLHSSKENAVQALRDTANTNAVEFDRLYYKEQSYSFTPNGHPFLSGNGVINHIENRCVYGKVDLVTGEVEAGEGPCWVN